MSEAGKPKLGWLEASYRFGPLRNALIAGILLGIGLLVETTGGPEIVATAIFAVAIVVGARYFAAEGFEELVEEREVGIEILMLLAAAGAIVFGLVEEAAALVFLYATAEAIEELTFARTRSAIRGLLDLAPKEAIAVRDGAEVRVPAAELSVGERFIVRAGDSVPTDGVIREGNSALNEAQVTGEPVPADKGPGDEIFAGSVNGTGALEVEATRAYEDNTLQRIVHLVEEAQEQKSQAQRFVDRFSLRYSPAVIVAALILAVVPPLLLGGDWTDWALRAVTLLVAAAPCALVMSGPVAAAAAISRAGREGILIKGGVQLEALARVDTICLDKTGTLTKGTPEVTDVIAVEGDEDACLATAAAVESRSEHPLAEAIVAAAKARDVEVAQAAEFEALMGSGARARVDGRELFVGSPTMFEELGAELGGIRDEISRLQEEGKTVALVGERERVIGLVAMRDELRPQAKEAIAALHRAGVTRISMLTGDNERTARAIAGEVGLDDVAAELRPEDKVSAIERLREEGRVVAMVGDGINDAPALARADVGIAMGTGGSDAAIEAADVALMADDIAKAAEAVRLGRRAARISRQNLIFSIVLLTLLIPGAVAGLLTVVAAVVIHEVSELLAVGNGVRAARSPVSPAPAPA